MEGWCEDTQNHHFHRIRHPTQTSNEGKLDLEFSETEGIDSLFHGKGIWRNSVRIKNKKSEVNGKHCHNANHREQRQQRLLLIRFAVQGLARPARIYDPSDSRRKRLAAKPTSWRNRVSNENVNFAKTGNKRWKIPRSPSSIIPLLVVSTQNRGIF
jgi:hypothetical protein